LNNWIEIDAPALAANFQATQQQIPGTGVLAVIKANAYGHGAELCGPILVRAGARWLGVTCASEGARVRRALEAASLAADILVMCGFLPADVPTLLAARLTPVLWTSEQVSWLAGTAVAVHVEVDTGMGRQGVSPGAAFDELLRQITAAGLRIDAVFTHFSSSEVAHSPLTAAQRERFSGAVGQLAPYRLTLRSLHAGNTSTVDNPYHGVPDPWLPNLAASVGATPMVRTGLALFGLCLPIEGDAVARLRPRLKPVLTWKAHVLSVRTLAAGETVGYNATFTAQVPMRVALLPVGYADGLRRELSSRNGTPVAAVLVHGQHAPILGRISMNLTVVDVTAIAGVAANDEAILLGPGLTAEDHARLARTIPYEILCGLHPCG
jgi:alanine racemase